MKTIMKIILTTSMSGLGGTETPLSASVACSNNADTISYWPLQTAL